MKEFELRKLNRKQLLELLLTQTKRVEELEEELKKSEAALRNRKMTELQAGNIADAAIRLNSVFEAAQAAADQYVENIICKSNLLDENLQTAEEEARKKAADMITEAEIKCYEREQRAEARLKEMEDKITRLRALSDDFNKLFIENQSESNTEK